MKLILKNLRQVEYEIIIQSDKISVKELKKEIENLYSFDSQQIKLVFNGTILDNGKKLSEYNITENSSIIIMNTKTKKIETLKPNETKTGETPTSKDEIKVQSSQMNQSNISDILNDNLNQTINSLVEMGFEISQVKEAVKAANGRIDLAVEYLNNGIPDNINKKSNIIKIETKVESDITKELKKTAGVIKMLCKDNYMKIFEILNNIEKNDLGLFRLISDYRDEFKNYLNEPINDEDKKNFENIENKVNVIEKERKEKREKEKQDKKKNEGKENKDDDKNKTKEIKEGEQNINNNNKEEEKKIDKTNENKDNNKEEEKKIDKPNENKDINNNNQLFNQLNEEEKTVVYRIKNFTNLSLDKVVESFIVCNKNEELTLNYLYDQ